MRLPSCKNNIKMNKKIMPIAIAALIGAGLGTYLSYGPLKQYKSEAVLNIEMDTAEYKRLTELANDQAVLRQYTANSKLNGVSAERLEALIKDSKKVDWLKPVLRLSKSDYKELPDAAVKLEQENIRKREQVILYENEKLFGKELTTNKNEFSAYTGLKITAFSPDPQLAADKTKWLSEYAHDAAAIGALHALIVKWENENKFFAERFQARKIQNEFETEQSKTKLTGLKKSIENYPVAVQKEVNREIEIGRDQTKTLSPMAQMLSIEVDLLEMDIKSQKLNRANEQLKISADILKQVATIKSEASGMNRLAMVGEILNIALNKAEFSSHREKLLLMQNEVSNIKSKLVKKIQYLSLPSVPLQQDGPAPIKLIILISLLFTALMAAYQWRTYILNLIKQDDAKMISQN